ncbi:MAG: hypothetical protein ACTILD_09190, partial [Pseudoalteromonas sp.]
PLCLSACTDADTGKNSLTPADNEVEKPINTKITPQSKTSVSKESIQQTRKQLNAQIDTRCDSSTQCQVLPVGNRACGGPSSYIVYSNKTTNLQKIEQLADKVTAQESQFNAQTGMMSICQHLSAPSAQCVENKCVEIEGDAKSVY